MRQVLLPVFLFASLACSGLVPTDPGAAPAPMSTDDGRTLPTGEVAPLTVVELAIGEETGLCEMLRRKLPGDEAIPLGAFGPTCPSTTLVTWTGDRVVVANEGGLWTDGTTGRPEAAEIPESPQVVVFDDAGVLHACAKIPAKAKEKDDATMVYEWQKKSYETTKLDNAKKYAMWVHWTLSDAHVPGKGKWSVAEASLEGDTEPDSVPVCQRLKDFPKDDPWVSSDGPGWTVSDWPEATGPDAALLGAIHAGAWRVAPSRSIAVIGRVEDQQFTPTSHLALWVAGAWKQIQDDVDVLWLTDEWVTVENEGELAVFSRRDGAIAYEDPADTLVFPWPAEAPLVAVPLPEIGPGAEPDPEPDAPPKEGGPGYVPGGKKEPAKDGKGGKTGKGR